MLGEFVNGADLKGLLARQGRLPEWLALEIVRDVIGADKDLMVDVNRAWDLATATEAVGLLEPLKPRWLEEPVRWADDRRELTLLSKRTLIPLAGEWSNQPT